MTSVLIDASNLRSGGGLQVATSFLDELADLVDDVETTRAFPWLSNVTVEASPELAANIQPASRRRVVSHVARRHWRDRRSWARPARLHDVSFCIFGPEYGPRRARHRITGFADSTSFRFDVPGIPAVGPVAQVQSIARAAASKRLFKRSDSFIVEAPHVKQWLARAWGISPGSISVVSNTVNTVFGTSSRWQPIRELPPTDRPRLGYVTRLYPHKNVEFLGLLGDELRRIGTPVEFVLTLNEHEWKMTSQRLRSHSVTVGPVSVAQLPATYAACDATVFPSLLEAFSAAPLESFASDKVVFASDRSFVRSVCGDAPVYIDPGDPVSSARTIASTLGDAITMSEHTRRGRAVVSDLPTSRDRALAYLRIIHEALP